MGKGKAKGTSGIQWCANPLHAASDDDDGEDLEAKAPAGSLLPVSPFRVSAAEIEGARRSKKNKQSVGTRAAKGEHKEGKRRTGRERKERGRVSVCRGTKSQSEKEKEGEKKQIDKKEGRDLRETTVCAYA